MVKCLLQNEKNIQYFANLIYNFNLDLDVWIWIAHAPLFQLPISMYSVYGSHVFNFFENTASVKMQDGTRIFTYHKQESIWCEKRCFVQVKFKTLLLSLSVSVSIVLYGSEEPSLFFWCSVKSQSWVCVSISDIKKKTPSERRRLFLFVEYLHSEPGIFFTMWKDILKCFGAPCEVVL